MRDLKLQLLESKQISKISDQLFAKLPDLLDHFGVEYIEYPNRYAFACPVHGGDNTEACTIFTEGNHTKGNWNCWTHHCEEEFTKNLFGFVRGALSVNSEERTSMHDTANFCLKFLNTDLSKLETYRMVEVNNDHRLLEVFDKQPTREPLNISREQIVDSIEIPAKYYINRGYAANTLKAFDVGLCTKKNKPMSGRVVVPVYDEDYNYVGCIGRATSTQMQPKWMHSRGFKKSAYLYGLHLAKDKMQETHAAVLVRVENV